jgi:hypothetical protein
MPLVQDLKTLFLQGLRAARPSLASAALLLPLLAAADSQVQTGAARATLRATAHLDFRIVIPRVLSLDLASGVESVRGAQTVAIFTNSHNVTLAATVHASDEARGNIILNAAARKVIAQNAACMPGLSRAAAASASGVICTASMP